MHPENEYFMDLYQYDWKMLRIIRRDTGQGGGTENRYREEVRDGSNGGGINWLKKVRLERSLV